MCSKISCEVHTFIYVSRPVNQHSIISSDVPIILYCAIMTTDTLNLGLIRVISAVLICLIVRHEVRGFTQQGIPDPHVHHGELLSEDAGHIQGHLKDIIDVDTGKMTPAELEFHYFKLHDYDQNNKLDGLEMLQALMHHSYGKPEPSSSQEEHPPLQAIDVLPYTNIVDEVLKDDDLDNDGYLSYEEYRHRVQKDAVKK